ncbi:hypothetical protein [Streptomyces neyagawaensis]|uniref:hypothetical protein n=1 Tax=Streptomyces neyagawaensis TaxID=42238 RepID=UPI0006E219D1|nr:hypothetical protein [Streptomyces neyagawaensis]MCL6735073.1 hypothetical protein [Streptomyces neyagawaensis]MDE1687468.1 hypothetical protein [Streptomyces neyagawaensis]
MQLVALLSAALLTTAAHPANPAAVPAQQAATLTITAPTTANLGTAAIGGTRTTQLGTITVNAQQAPSWTATVTATHLTTNGGTISNGNIRYWSGLATATSGAGTCTPGQPTAAQAVPLNATRSAFTRTGGNNTHSCSWNPTLTITVPSTAVAGTYQATITHSVA